MIPLVCSGRRDYLKPECVHIESRDHQSALGNQHTYNRTDISPPPTYNNTINRFYQIPIHLPTYPSSHPCRYPSIHPSVHLSTYLYVHSRTRVCKFYINYISTYPPSYLSLRRLTHPYTHLHRSYLKIDKDKKIEVV